MNQALHIFGKDTRHLRWEILVSLALLAAYVWVAPVEWRQASGVLGANVVFASEMSLIVGALTVLVPVSWWLVITRAVHDENLIGDQQWWVTKPYDWGNLLGAKMLFLAVFIFVPVFVMECVLLAWAGFHPMSVLPALGLHLAVLAVVIVLPLLAIATVTSTIARSTLTVLGIVLVFIAAVATLAYSTANGGFDVPGTGWPVAILFVIVAGAAIVLQYARRIVWKARLILIAAVPLVIVAVSVSQVVLVGLKYRTGTAALQFTLSRNSTSILTESGPGDVASISVPVTIAGVANDGGVVVEGMQATLETADGQRWATGWQEQFSGVSLPGTGPNSYTSLSIRLKRSFEEREAEKAVTLRLRLAVAELRAGQPVQIAMPEHEFQVPGFGICMPVERSAAHEFSNLSCRAAVQEPVKTLIHVQWSDVPCSDQKGSDAMIQGEGWAGSLEPGSDLGLNPVEQVGFYLSNNYKMVGQRMAGPRFLCPGTPITFTPYRLVRRAGYDATFVNFVMPKEGTQQPGGGYGGYSVGVHVGD